MLFTFPTGVTILWSLVQSGGKFKPPGIPIEMGQHPRLKAEIESIAASFGEPVPREVYLIGLPGAYVSERGGLSQTTKVRALSIGLPLIATLNVSQFRAVLAHEFAHFYAGDTRLSPWIYSSRASMARVLINLNTGRVSHYLKSLARSTGIVRIAYRIVFGSLNQYWSFLLRITNLLSRRQEYRSDELACRVAGTAAFTEALETVTIVAAMYLPYWKATVSPLLINGLRPPLVDGFIKYLATPNVKKRVKAIIEGDLNKLSDDPLGTHPPLGSRILRASRVPDLIANNNVQPATTLLVNLDSLEEQLIAFMTPANEVAKLKKMDWDTAASEVYIPIWHASAQRHLQVLGTYSIGEIPELLQEIKATPPSIPDPPGKLLTDSQSEDRKQSFVWMAMTLCLIRAGWNLHIQPGQTWIALKNDRVDPQTLIEGVRSGRTSPAQWRSYCEKLGIADLPLTSGLGSRTERRNQKFALVALHHDLRDAR